MTYRRKRLGQKGEEAAARYLEERGCRLLSRNYTCAAGEIDLIALDKGVIVFVEVRSRSSCRFDVIAVLFDEEGVVSRLEHITNAF